MDMTTALTIKAQVVGQGQISGLSSGLKKVEGQSTRTAGAMMRLRGAAAGAMGALRAMLPVLGTAALVSFAKGNIDAADSMSKLSQRTGIAAPELDKFRKVAELSDTSIESLSRAFPALTKNMDAAAQKGKGPAFEAFQRLGLSVKNADGTLKSADTMMLQISDRFQGMADGSEKAALASAIFGTRIGSELIPMLNSGGDAVRNMSTSLTQEFADGAATFNDKIENMQEKLGNLGIKLVETLLPTLEKIVDIVATVVDAFMALPEPVQNAIIAFGAFKLVAPLFAGLIPAITGIVTSLGGIVTALTGGGGALAAIAAVFTGPVGWIALAVAAGVAIYKFRDQIAEVFQFIGDVIMKAWELYKSVYIDPIVNAAKMIYDVISENWQQIFDFVSGIITNTWNFFDKTFIQPLINAVKNLLETFKSIFTSIGEAIKSPIQAAFNFIKGIVNSILQGIGNAINGVLDAINRVIQAANAATSKVGLPSIPQIPRVSVPQFAQGGMVNGAQLAVVGEAGPEYIVPAGKAQGFAQNILAGVRGPGAIPAYAEGGYVGPVNITTGPVMQQGGTNYVTMAQFEAGIRDVAAAVTRNGRSYGARRFTGIS